MLKHRVLVAALLGPLFLWIIYLGRMPLAILILLLCSLMWHEFQKITLPTITLPERVLTFILGLVICGRSLGLIPNLYPNLFLAGLVLLLFILLLKNPLPIENSINKLSLMFLGLFYCFALLPYLSNLREEPHGLGLVLLALLTTWSGDTSAYFCGRAWGKAKLYPTISPGKTRAGAYGALVGALACSFAVIALFNIPISTGHTIVLGVLIAISGILGDLAESMLKRAYDVKDSSNILPGHGGILDRFDAFLFVIPITYCYCTIVLDLSGG